jgi:TRAP-type mannitol/chloroaromatic compound transport system substrate-binding protein
MSIPKTLPVWGSGVLAFADQVKQMSQGRLEIKVFGAGELAPALEVFEAVQNGTVEMGHSAAYYWQGKMPAAPFFTSVPFGLNASGMRSWVVAGGGQELWDELYGNYNVKAIPAGNTGLQMGGWFNRPIESVADLKGLKMRIPGLGGLVMRAAGAKPVLVAGGEIYTSLSTGVIDAAEWVGPCHDYILGLHKVAKHYYFPGWQEPGPCLELLIHKKAWDALSEDLKAIVLAAARHLDVDMHAKWLAEDARYLQKIRSETKVELRSFPKDVLSELHRISEQVLLDVSRSDAISKRIYESYRNFEKTFLPFQKVTDWAYNNTLEQLQKD